jgi:hypothetical protein
MACSSQPDRLDGATSDRAWQVDCRLEINKPVKSAPYSAL